MNILATQYTLSRKSLEIYLAGCKGDKGVHCTSCHNPETWNFNQGRKYGIKYASDIYSKVASFSNMIDNIEIFGGN